MENSSVNAILNFEEEKDSDTVKKLTKHLVENSSICKEIDKKMGMLLNILINREKPFLDMNETSKYLGISKHTLYGYTCKGILPFYKLQGRRIYFRVKELDDFILQSKNRCSSNYELEEKVETRMALDRKKKKK